MLNESRPHHVVRVCAIDAARVAHGIDPCVNCLHRFRSQPARHGPQRRERTADVEPSDSGDEQGEQENRPAESEAPQSLLSALTRRRALLGMGAVAGVAAVDVGGFAYAGGWLRPEALTPGRFADRFEHVYGRHDGFRRNHAKGLSATGSFVSNGAGAALCRAAVFRPGNVPVIGRFSLGGGLPEQADKPDTVRGLGLLFGAPAGQQWRTAMINFPVFTDSTPQGFYERLLASKPMPGNGQPDPQKLAAFLERH